MATTNALIRHALIWSLAVPLQGFPAMSCGCTVTGAAHTQMAESDSPCCCSERVALAENSCCAGSSNLVEDGCCGCRCGTRSSACRCGEDCQCGKSQNPKPAVPPTTNTDLSQKLTSMLLAISAVGLNYSPPIFRQRNGATIPVDCVSAAEKCAYLCRFTL